MEKKINAQHWLDSSSQHDHFRMQIALEIQLSYLKHTLSKFHEYNCINIFIYLFANFDNFLWDFASFSFEGLQVLKLLIKASLLYSHL